MLLLSAMVLSPALGREVIHQGRAADPDEAWYLLLRPTTCRTAVVVGSDGVPLDAQARACSALLRPAIEEAALRWRFERSPTRTVEVIEVPVRPPASRPPPRGGVCQLGFEVAWTADRGVAYPSPLDEEIPPRCRLEARDAKVEIPDSFRPTTAWCQVEVIPTEAGLTTRIGACSGGYEAAARELVQAWSFPRGQDLSWRLVLGFYDADGAFY